MDVLLPIFEDACHASASTATSAPRGFATTFMLFTKRLRRGVRDGTITLSVRMWLRPHVKVGHRYRMEEGEIEVDSVESITADEVTPELARASGFRSAIDLLAVAQHGRGKNLYLVRFHYVEPGASRPSKP